MRSVGSPWSSRQIKPTTWPDLRGHQIAQGRSLRSWRCPPRPWARWAAPEGAPRGADALAAEGGLDVLVEVAPLRIRTEQVPADVGWDAVVPEQRSILQLDVEDAGDRAVAKRDEQGRPDGEAMDESWLGHHGVPHCACPSTRSRVGWRRGARLRAASRIRCSSFSERTTGRSARGKEALATSTNSLG